MPTFKYVATDRAGKSIDGTLEAPDRTSLLDIMRRKNLIVVKITEMKQRAAKKGKGGGKVKMDELAVFSRQLATMVDAGIPLVQSLDILSDQIENKAFGNVLSNVRKDVEAGSSLSEGFAKYPRVFSGFFINMVKAGESSGMLDDILERVATYFEDTAALQRKVKSALMYPMVISCMAVGVVVVLMIKVIPVFKEIFSGFGAALPMPTQILITISEIMQKYFFVGIGLFVGISFITRKYLDTPGGRLRMDTILLKMPIFGILFRKIAVSKFTRTLSTLVKSGVSILNALEIVAKTSGNRVVELAVDKVRSSVKEGENIADPLAKSGVFPAMVTRMISVGEQSGELEKMLSKIADFYDEQVDAAVSGLTSLIEPLIIAFLGIVIGSVVIAMFLPIFKMSSVMSGAM